MIDASQEASRDEVVAIEEENEEATIVVGSKRDSSMHPPSKEGSHRYSNFNKATSVFHSPYKSESYGSSKLNGTANNGASPNLNDVKAGKFFSSATPPTGLQSAISKLKESK
jgi:hypothetical protein